mmetsp:Transcript_66230/g.138004  ORF Transcript_66230/g.138004 Transcript_66230/m.138004 type:complete len:303 (+) Transcript_66230:582-1490(+)
MLDNSMALYGCVLDVAPSILGLVTNVNVNVDGAQLDCIRYQLVGSVLESTSQQKAVLQLPNLGQIALFEARIAPSAHLVPRVFWESWMSYTPDYFLIVGAGGDNADDGINPILVNHIRSSAITRVCWSTLSLTNGLVSDVLKTNVAYKVDLYLVLKYKLGKETRFNHMIFNNISSVWLYAVLSCKWVEAHAHQLNMAGTHGDMHEIRGSCKDFEDFFGQDISVTTTPAGDGQIRLGHREGYHALTWRFSPCKSALLMLVFDSVSKYTESNGEWGMSWDSATAVVRSQANAAARPHSPSGGFQ